MSSKEMAVKMMVDVAERKEAEKMMCKKFEDMSIDERRLSASMLAAFDGIWNK